MSSGGTATGSQYASCEENSPRTSAAASASSRAQLDSSSSLAEDLVAVSPDDAHAPTGNAAVSQGRLWRMHDNMCFADERLDTLLDQQRPHGSADASTYDAQGNAFRADAGAELKLDTQNTATGMPNSDAHILMQSNVAGVRSLRASPERARSGRSSRRMSMAGAAAQERHCDQTPSRLSLAGAVAAVKASAQAADATSSSDNNATGSVAANQARRRSTMRTSRPFDAPMTRDRAVSISAIHEVLRDMSQSRHASGADSRASSAFGASSRHNGSPQGSAELEDMFGVQRSPGHSVALSDWQEGQHVPPEQEWGNRTRRRSSVRWVPDLQTNRDDLTARAAVVNAVQSVVREMSQRRAGSAENSTRVGGAGSALVSEAPAAEQNAVIAQLRASEDDGEHAHNPSDAGIACDAAAPFSCGAHQEHMASAGGGQRASQAKLDSQAHGDFEEPTKAAALQHELFEYADQQPVREFLELDRPASLPWSAAGNETSPQPELACKVGARASTHDNAADQVADAVEDSMQPTQACNEERCPSMQFSTAGEPVARDTATLQLLDDCTLEKCSIAQSSDGELAASEQTAVQRAEAQHEQGSTSRCVGVAASPKSSTSNPGAVAESVQATSARLMVNAETSMQPDDFADTLRDTHPQRTHTTAPPGLLIIDKKGLEDSQVARRARATAARLRLCRSVLRVRHHASAVLPGLLGFH